MQRRAGGAGVILRFERVRARRAGRFQPLKSHEITPAFLDRTIVALKRWKFDIVSMDEACQRAVTLASPRRFVCLTFDGAYKDLMTSAYPLLAKHGVPFTVYVPTAFPDRLGEAWWLALEAVIARENRVSLVMDRKEQRFHVGNTSEKSQLYDFLEGWMRSLPPATYRDGRGGRLRQCGVGDIGRRRDRGANQSARASAHRLGRTTAFAAGHARDSFGHHIPSGQARSGFRGPRSMRQWALIAIRHSSNSKETRHGRCTRQSDGQNARN